jgi:FkbM family methyltransferase
MYFLPQMTLKTHPTMTGHCAKVLAGEYEIRNLRLPEKPTIIDIGANCGAFTGWALKRWPDAKIFAYEPNPEALKFLSLNFVEDSRVDITSAAVTTKGKAMLHRGKNNIGEASLNSIGEQDGKPFRVDSAHPKSLPAADLIKLDCEGEELSIIKAARKMIAKAQAVVLEWHNDKEADEILAILKSDGFEASVERTMIDRGIMKAWKPGAIQADTSRVMFGIPTHYGPTTQFACSLMQLRDAFPGAYINFLDGDSHVDRARNRIANQFMNSEYEWLIFLDADLAFNAEDILRLYAHGKDVIAGFYAKKKTGPAEWVCNPLTTVEDDDGLLSLREAGTGCLCIHRNVFSKMKRAWPELEYIADGSGGRTEFAYFQSGPVFDEERGIRRWLSEDWLFCKRARQLGFTIYADRSVVLLHQGSCMFPIVES